MGFTVQLFSFSKRPNSTKRPSGSTNTFTGVVKDSCNIIAPSIGFQFAIEEPPVNFNYAYIPAFERYYFINNWNYSNRLWWADMSVDVLASYKTEIGASTQYILRSSNLHNGLIADSMYPVTAERSAVRTDNDSEYGFVSNTPDGFFVIGVISPDSGSFGSTCYYQLSNTAFNTFKNNLLSSIDWADISTDEISLNLQKALINPFQYITSCKWFPLPLNDPPNEVSGIKLGYWEIPCTAYKILNPSLATRNYGFSLPKHPQIERGAYLNTSPYTKRAVFIHPLGWRELEINSPFTEELSIIFNVDVISANCYVRIIEDDLSAPTQVYTCECGVDVPLAQITQTISTGNITESLISSASQRFMGGLTTDIAAAIASIGGGSLIDPGGQVSGGSIAAHFGSTLVPSIVTANGASASPTLYKAQSYVVSIFSHIAEEDNPNLGRPLCLSTTVSSLPGYLQIADPDFSSSATEQENNMIRSFMSGGFFYE